MSWTDLPELLIALVVIVAAARLLGAAARRLGQPAVIGEIAAGILLGPTLAQATVTAAVFPPRVRPALAILINTRGLTELIVLTVGLQLGLFDQDLHSRMVLMALVTTAMTGVLLRLVYPPERVRQDVATRGAAAAAEVGTR